MGKKWRKTIFQLLPLDGRYFLTVSLKTLTQTILYLETHDYQINFVNIDSCHHYGIFGAIVQMSFLSKGPLVTRNEERWLVYLQASL